MTSNLAANQIVFAFEDLEPQMERIKLDGDEYDTGNKKSNKEDAAAGATMEIYKSLDSLTLENRIAIKEAIETNMLSGCLLGYPMVNTRVTVVDGRWSNIRSKNPLIFKQAVT
jgi:translation elongation factor EF-G